MDYANQQYSALEAAQGADFVVVHQQEQIRTLTAIKDADQAQQKRAQ